MTGAALRSVIAHQPGAARRQNGPFRHRRQACNAFPFYLPPLSWVITEPCLNAWLSLANCDVMHNTLRCLSLITCPLKTSFMLQKPNAQEIYVNLRDMIIALEITPGSRVTETQLADYFDVSRTPVRAALQRLESEGFLTIRSKQGCFIRNIDMLQISHYYDVRVSLENLVLEEIGKLKNLSEVEELAEQWDPKALHFGVDANDDLKIAEENFHRELARISRNEVLLGYINDINNHIRAVRRLGWPNSKSVTDTYEEHYRICTLLLQRDLAAAQEEMTHHIRKSQDQANRITLHQLYGNRRAVVFE